MYTNSIIIEQKVTFVKFAMLYKIVLAERIY